MQITPLTSGLRAVRGRGLRGLRLILAALIITCILDPHNRHNLFIAIQTDQVHTARGPRDAVTPPPGAGSRSRLVIKGGVRCCAVEADQ